MSAVATELSVVLAAPTLDVARQALDCYRGQSAAARLELVLVAPPAELARLTPGDRGALGALRGVAAPVPFELASARAAGVGAASSRWVFIGETHSFAEPEMAARLLAATMEPTGSEPSPGFVPCIYNVNPSGAVSWASFLIDYGAWGPGHAAGARLAPPIYNGVFARAELARLDGELVKALSPHDDSVAPLPDEPRFHTPFVPAARIGHLNVVRFVDFVASKSRLGLAVADARARRWGLGRRLAYAAAWPLIGVVLLGRYLRFHAVARTAGRLPAGVLPLFVVGAFARAAAEAIGYLGLCPAGLFGRLEHLEIFKADYVPGWQR